MCSYPFLLFVCCRFPLPGTYHFRFKMKWNDESMTITQQQYFLHGRQGFMLMYFKAF